MNIRAAEFPYRLQRSDIAVSLAAAALFGAGTILEFTHDAPPALPRGSLHAADINRFDRSATRRWAPVVDNLSDYATGAMLIAPAAAGIPLLRDRAWMNLATLTAMYGEAVVLTLGASAAVKALTHRNRPYLYNTALSDAEFSALAAEGDGRRSFFSQHTALAFCSALFLSTTVTDIYGLPKAPTASAVWIASCAAATAIGASRYVAGQHFPTDVIAGAVVGSLAGYGIPLMHRRGNNRLSVEAAGNRLIARWRF